MKKALALLLVSLAVVSFSPARGVAAESQGYLFAVEMVPPANQIGNLGYYHIPGQPGEQITLQAQLTNHTHDSLEIKVVPMNAYSSQSGIFYQSPLEVDAKAYPLFDEQYGLAQYISQTNPITLLPDQTQVVSIKVTVPNLTSGTLLGSIRFVTFAGTQAIQTADPKNQKAQMLIDKYQAIDTAIQIDLPQPAQPSVAVGNATFDGDQIGVRVAITNQAAIIQEKTTGTYEIRDSENALLFSGAIQSFKMAPMTGFQYPLPWHYKTLAAGTYHLNLTLTVNSHDNSFEKTFTVSQQGIVNAQQAQEKINPMIQPSFPSWLVVVLEVFVLITIVFFLKLLRMKHLASRKS